MKKIFCLALCLLLTLSLTACIDKSLLPRTVSLMTQETIHHADGSTTEWNYEYDRRGNLISAEFDVGSYDVTCRYAYNTLGYLTEVTETSVTPSAEYTDVTQYQYTLQGKLPKTCQVYKNGQEQYTCTFQTKNGLITRVDFEHAIDTDRENYARWHTYEYDKAGNLLKESFCSLLPPGSDPELCIVTQYRYEYDESGSLSALFCERSMAPAEIQDAEKCTFQQLSVLRFARNDAGQLTALTLNDTTVPYTITDSGISLPDGCENWEIDATGKVLTSDDRSYTYETVTLFSEDADRFNCWDVLLRMAGNFYYGNTLLRLQCLPEFGVPQDCQFYYYLIPSPLA